MGVVAGDRPSSAIRSYTSQTYAEPVRLGLSVAVGCYPKPSVKPYPQP